MGPSSVRLDQKAFNMELWARLRDIGWKVVGLQLEVMYPVRVFYLLGVETLIVINAAGGLNGS
ncbi:hypothetical protein PAMP_012789 [Pampus punctatissimus]